MVLFEIEEFRKDLAKIECKTAKSRINYQNKLNELELRFKDLQNDYELFQGFLDKKRITLEKIFRYFREYLKKKSIAIEKFRLHTNSLRIEQQKLTKKLENRQNIRSNLCETDYEQLRITNSELRIELETIKEPHENNLKKSINESNVKLTDVKMYTKTQEIEIEQLTKAIEKKNEQIAKMNEMLIAVDHENKKLSSKIDQLTDTLDTFEVPKVLDFLHLKNNLNNLKNECKFYERRKLIRKSLNLQTKRNHFKSQFL